MGGMGNNNCNEVRMRRHGAHGAAPAVTMSVQRCSLQSAFQARTQLRQAAPRCRPRRGEYSAALVI